MLTRNSRYKDSAPFQPDADGNEVFPGLRPRTIGPATPVVEHAISAGDRLDHLARHYYNDDRRWWRLIDANPALQHGDEALSADKAGEALPVPKLKE